MITSLTKEQTDKFPEYIEKWIKIGLCTDPANRLEAEKSIVKCYKLAGLSPPKKIVWCGSPFSQALVREIILHKKLINDIQKNVVSSVWGSSRESVGDSVKDSVTDSVMDNVIAKMGSGVILNVRGSVWDSVRNSVWSSMMDNMKDSMMDSVILNVWGSLIDNGWSSVRESVRESVWESVTDAGMVDRARDNVMNNVKDSVRENLSDNVVGSVRESVWNSMWKSMKENLSDIMSENVWERMWENLSGNVRRSFSENVKNNVILNGWENLSDILKDIVWDNVRGSVWDSLSAAGRVGSIWNSVNDSGYGQHDSNWIAFYEFFRNECGLVSQTEKLVGLTELAKHAGWWLPHKNICWVSERHCILNRDDRGRIHSLTNPSIAYPDGWKIYAIHGVRVPEFIINNPEKISVENIEAESNVEIKRVMIDRFGMSRYLNESGAKLISKDKFGELYRKELDNDEPLTMIKVINSTPEPDGTLKNYFLRVPPDCKTAKEAVAWTFGLQKKEYSPKIET